MQAVIRTSIFLANAAAAGLSEEDQMVIVSAISREPTMGEMMVGTGGCRKVRFPGKGKGKSGGYRTVHYFAGDDVPILLLALIDKGERDNLSKAERNELKRSLATYAEEYRDGARRKVKELARRRRV
jgi:hypothetical protein